MLPEKAQNELMVYQRAQTRRSRSAETHYREPGIDGGRPLAEGSLSFMQCQWIDGEPKERRFCHAPVSHAGASYCPEHSRRVFRSPEEGEAVE
jgi:hypothetical protein